MRFNLDNYKEIVETLARNRSRTLLTAFGIFWGIFMLLIMLGGGDGLKAVISKNFDGFSTNAVFVGCNNTSKPYGGFKRGRGWLMDASDVTAIKAAVQEADAVAMTNASFNATSAFADKSFAGPLKGFTTEYLKVETPEIAHGRWLNEVDIAQERKVCVIGKRVWETLFPRGENPVGKNIRVNNTYFMVVGLDVSQSSININGSADETIVIPYNVLDKLYHLGGKFWMMAMTVKDGMDSQVMQDKVRGVLARKHTIDPTDKNAIFIMDTQKIFSIVDNLFKGLNILIFLVGIGTLLAGAIGVSNIMMVTVKERTTEIGIRRAIGATPKMILSQIIAESIMLTTIAGVIGILVSVFILAGMTKLIGMSADMSGVSFQIGFWSAVAVLLLVIVLGIFAGLAPALRAMSIKPVDAMRDE